MSAADQRHKQAAEVCLPCWAAWIRRLPPKSIATSARRGHVSESITPYSPIIPMPRHFWKFGCIKNWSRKVDCTIVPHGPNFLMISTTCALPIKSCYRWLIPGKIKGAPRPSIAELRSRRPPTNVPEGQLWFAGALALQNETRSPERHHHGPSVAQGLQEAGCPPKTLWKQPPGRGYVH